MLRAHEVEGQDSDDPFMPLPTNLPDFDDGKTPSIYHVSSLFPAKTFFEPKNLGKCGTSDYFNQHKDCTLGSDKL